ncbi:conserved hypothetical protein [Arcobacter nitrofigilis DSM 7299]|uniref:Polysaccharide deacetylase n=1 Tax=Arcobacter nitrofigilis (strain ATCC 33309 / DSM 7299 / CCUG 15893 / LMG 7604 / NCTC 12251 / CI) TaxID=572480 RepID=D5V027_ARCNC|nr:hypothetical protein [Arcobacter nitrofigilis]ADG93639.1 conserved hypothetical protein [Arcobacter nitrofigilis DSM 7299]
MKNHKVLLCYLSLVVLLALTPLKADVQLDTSKIKNYKVIKSFYKDSKNKFLIIRSYNYKTKTFFLAINLNSLKTTVMTQNEKEKLTKADKSILENTNYNILVNKALQNSFALSNAGINDSIKKKPHEMYLTIDMCPSSKKGYEQELFEKFLDLKQIDKKIPIAISITYRWVKGHKKEFLSLINNKKLDITWINHSRNHYYDKNEKVLEKNFMLYFKTNLNVEILDVEKMLLLNNQIPSIFFRFPGLISSAKINKRVINEFSLIPLGTSNWLVKSKKVAIDGNIILVHGNLNEHEGIKMLFKEVKDVKVFKSIYKPFLIE